MYVIPGDNVMITVFGGKNGDFLKKKQCYLWSIFGHFFGENIEKNRNIVPRSFCIKNLNIGKETILIKVFPAPW
jgi:hypothetical protein